MIYECRIGYSKASARFKFGAELIMFLYKHDFGFKLKKKKDEF
jgi:hypothetical protein